MESGVAKQAVCRNNCPKGEGSHRLGMSKSSEHTGEVRKRHNMCCEYYPIQMKC